MKSGFLHIVFILSVLLVFGGQGYGGEYNPCVRCAWCQKCVSENGRIYCVDNCPPCQRCIWDGTAAVCCSYCSDDEKCCTDDPNKPHGYCCGSDETCCNGHCCGECKTCVNGECRACDPDKCETCIDGECKVCGGDTDKKCCDGSCVDKCENTSPTGQCDTSQNENYECIGCTLFPYDCSDFTTRIYTGYETLWCTGGCPGECVQLDAVHCYSEYKCMKGVQQAYSICSTEGDGVACEPSPWYPEGLWFCSPCVKNPADPLPAFYVYPKACQ